MRDYSDDRFVLMDQIHKIAESQFSFPHIRSFNPEIVQFIRSEFERKCCDFCDLVRMSSGFRGCCEGFQDTIRQHLFDPMPLEIRKFIDEFIANGQSNFPGSLNRDLYPVIHHTKIVSPNAGASAVFLTGTPSTGDSYRQFITPVYRIFNTLDRQSPGTGTGNHDLAKAILGQNMITQEYVKDKISDAIEKLQSKLIGWTDTGMNLAIMNVDGISAESADWKVLHGPY
jgi:hypothetical protein